MGIEKAIEHIRTHHADADGWITLARKDEYGQYTQHHYRYADIQEELEEWLGYDIYFSQNTFYKPQRRIENIRQLRSLYVDVDCHLFNFTPEYMIGRMELELFGEKVPEPNFIIHSGRGFVVIWLIEPVPYMALPLWQAIEQYFIEQFSELGGDPKATDAARVFRLAGSRNSKSREEVTVQYRHEYRYELRQIQEDYLPDQQRKKLKKSSKPASLFNTYSLYYARLQDLSKLLQLRNYNVRGYREIICFLYRYWSCCFLQNEAEALEHTLDLNAQFAAPLSEREVVKATQSAEKAWNAKNNAEADRLAKERGYPGAGYNISNEKIIQWLDITEEEQKHLSTIIGRKEKQKRDTQATRMRRREAGAVPREVYLGQAEKRRAEAFKMRQEGMKIKEVAEAMGITENAVKSLLRTQRKKSVKSVPLD